MNFLSHHFVARRVAPNQPALFYAGNILPDLVGMSGEGSLKSKQVDGQVGPLADGVRLHLVCDKAFHSDAAFVMLCQQTGELFRAAAFEIAPKRVFFLAHVAVELALDAILIRRQLGIEHDLDAHVIASQSEIIPELTLWLDNKPLLELQRVIDGFIAHPFTHEYATAAGLAYRLDRVAQRATLSAFDPRDKSTLTEVLEQTIALAMPEADALLSRVGNAT
jgi:hypothetical protein